jgi:hypothetical protein
LSSDDADTIAQNLYLTSTRVSKIVNFNNLRKRFAKKKVITFSGINPFFKKHNKKSISNFIVNPIFAIIFLFFLNSFFIDVGAQVKIWFQNRRARDRRERKDNSIEQQPINFSVSSSHYFLPTSASSSSSRIKDLAIDQDRRSSF